ncbi:unnamed protein product [Porites evermanni]|uniref:Uncharacterized protein n=1 Tax=Porites evermanni TaxID=104178 RepID=A0ABN8LYQ5_9CNID|nr:unnamed protein product [Porites evermanni]
MSRGQDAVVHIREERAVVGGVLVAKKTVIAATDGRIFNFLFFNCRQAIGAHELPVDIFVWSKSQLLIYLKSFLAYQVNTVQAAGSGSGNNNPSIGSPGHAQGAPLPSYPQQGGYPTSRPVVIADPPERDCSYYCFACDGDSVWYNPRGKGICWVLLLLLFWLLVGAIVIPLTILYLTLGCLVAMFGDDD